MFCELWVKGASALAPGESFFQNKAANDIVLRCNETNTDGCPRRVHKRK